MLSLLVYRMNESLFTLMYSITLVMVAISHKSDYFTRAELKASFAKARVCYVKIL